MNEFGRDDVELLDEQVSYRGFFQIRTLKFRHRLYRGGWSDTVSRELFLRHDAVGVLLYDPKLDVVALVEQIRVGVFGHEGSKANGRSPWMLELVAGLIDKAETPEQVGRRESQEEAGADVTALEPIAEYFSSPGGSNEYFYLYAGRADLSDAEGVYGLEHESEDIRAFVIPVEELWQMLEQGELINAHTLIAVQWLRVHHDRLRRAWS